MGHALDSMPFVNTVQSITCDCPTRLDASPQKRGYKDDQIAELIKVMPPPSDGTDETEGGRDGKGDAERPY